MSLLLWIVLAVVLVGFPLGRDQAKRVSEALDLGRPSGLAHGGLPFGLWLQAQSAPAALPVGETECASGAGAFWGNRLQGPCPALGRFRSWAEGAPKRAEGGARWPRPERS